MWVTFSNTKNRSRICIWYFLLISVIKCKAQLPLNMCDLIKKYNSLQKTGRDEWKILPNQRPDYEERKWVRSCLSNNIGPADGNLLATE